MSYAKNQMPAQLFQVGDVVRIVYEPYMRCPFNWVPDMDECCGVLTAVREVHFRSDKKVWQYKVAGFAWSWCENCFVIEQEIEESATDIAMLLS